MGGENAGEMFGLGRMLNALNVDPQASPKQTLMQVRRALDDFARDAERFDDVTMLCLEYKEKRNPARDAGTE